MTIAITNTRTGKLTVCCITCAADMIGVERATLYKMLRDGKSEYRHFTFTTNIEVIKHKARGRMNVLPR